MELKSLEPDESKSFLLARTRRADDDPAENEAISALAKELGHLPLRLNRPPHTLPNTKKHLQIILRHTAGCDWLYLIKRASYWRLSA